MAIVHEKYNPTPKTTQVDPKTGKPLPASALPPRAASPAMEGFETSSGGGFFGSFFKGGNKKKMANMEPPPPTLKASSTLSDKETQEVEVISMSFNKYFPSQVLIILELLISSYFNIVRRTMIDMVPKAIMLNLVS
jgi:vacuolar protein sorting-associated protein 1